MALHTGSLLAGLWGTRDARDQTWIHHVQDEYLYLQCYSSNFVEIDYTQKKLATKEVIEMMDFPRT